MASAVEQQPASPAGPEERPGFIARGRSRRRLRFLRKARELAYRDLGGLVFNLHRFGQRNDALVLAKLTTLGHIDSELRALEKTLHEPQPITVLSEAGITACARCAAIHSSEDRFCPNCGLPLHRHADLPADLRTGSSPAAATPGAASGQPAAGAFQSSFAPPAPPATRGSGPGVVPASQATASHPVMAPPPPEPPLPATPAGATPAGATSAGRAPVGDPPPTAEHASAEPSAAEQSGARETGAGQADDEATAIVRPPANQQ